MWHYKNSPLTAEWLFSNATEVVLCSQLEKSCESTQVDSFAFTSKPFKIQRKYKLTQQTKRFLNNRKQEESYTINNKEDN